MCAWECKILVNDILDKRFLAIVNCTLFNCVTETHSFWYILRMYDIRGHRILLGSLNLDIVTERNGIGWARNEFHLVACRVHVDGVCVCFCHFSFCQTNIFFSYLNMYICVNGGTVYPLSLFLFRLVLFSFVSLSLSHSLYLYEQRIISLVFIVQSTQ